MTEAWWRDPAGLPPEWERSSSKGASTGATGQELPEGVTRSRDEVQTLRDDALASLPLDPVEVRVSWCSPRGLASGLEGIIDTTRWLLGEREAAPISVESHPYPRLPVKSVRLHAQDAVFEHKWPGVSEWYAGGVKRTVEWAMGFSTAERPISE
ncbi:hypothetical protein [Streptomyces sp. WMMB303]|uniref:hypothetical protein n=1 Tax=unclassified Streptomyces TaxID=2593676 RepID=UPI0023EBC1EF|nr:hypothetical protein [Streptomyces sp. WMMB303]MDF4254679.1 hypothetical protein [Streptomyces sp. WMMB303]